MFHVNDSLLHKFINWSTTKVAEQIQLPVAFGRTDDSELTDVIFAVGVANIAVTLAVDAVCVTSVSVVNFVVDTKGMTVDVTFKVVVFAVAGNVVVAAVALVGGVTVVDKVALGSTLVVVCGVRVVVLILAVVVLAVASAATVGLVTVGSVVAFTEMVDCNDVEPEVTVLLAANKTRL